ncbi:MAG TPA: LysR substrate-binding domain-containing protein [Herbaspirillum sp.]|jgi:LysR family glycine cleavage system transcriptional activator
MPTLPPLNYFRSFIVVGRHLNLVRASGEMNLTASALSHQLKMLENQLGIKLFTRNGRGLAFTKAGLDLHAEVDACLTRLSHAIDSATREQSGNTLVVNALPTFAMRWLLPRFSNFEYDHTRLDIRVSTKWNNFEHDAIDCAIYSGQAERAGMTTEFLRDETLIVVCAPTAITPEKPLKCADDLIHHQLLHVRSRSTSKDKLDDWETWLRAIGIKEHQDQKGLVLENRNFIIQAAKSGVGIAVVDPLVIQEELKSGQLIQPLSTVVKSSCAYYLAYPSSTPPPKKVIAFRNWLLKELEQDDQASAH